MLNVYSIPHEALLVARPVGIFNRKCAESLIDFIEIKEELADAGFDRFADLTRLKEIQLTREDVLQLAARRRAFNPNDIPVKSAFLAVDPMAWMIASMYELVLDSPRIEVKTFQDLQSAAKWLGVQANLLTL
jgi:hypothetical protein